MMCRYAIAPNDDEHCRAINGKRVFMEMGTKIGKKGPQ